MNINYCNAVVRILILTSLIRLLSASEKSYEELGNNYLNAIKSNKGEAIEIREAYKTAILEAGAINYEDTKLIMTLCKSLCKIKGNSIDYSLGSVPLDEITEINIRGYKIIDIIGCGGGSKLCR